MTHKEAAESLLSSFLGTSYRLIWLQSGDIEGDTRKMIADAQVFAAENDINLTIPSNILAIIDMWDDEL